ncbi:MAG: type II toxin-antitoxin system PemK/MazF family toxin [Ignavibacteriae bacterium]|nr:MAG: type II toxin-antitoxin system PemK/MazF family toxin [Ignavibacteriota bacterium]
MKKEGQIVLFRFPQTNLIESKLRPAILITKIPGEYPDWLSCMITSQLKHNNSDFDVEIKEHDDDFTATGLKADSVIRTTRLAVVDEKILLGKIGEISSDRLTEIKQKISDWILK